MNCKSIPSWAVANYFIERAFQDSGCYMSALKLVKLVYISHGWSLALKNVPLVSDRIEAWKYGPMIPNLLEYISISANEERIVYPIGPKLSFKKYEIDKEFLYSVWKNYKDFNGVQLANLCNRKSSSYDIVAREFYFKESQGGPKIPDDIIKKEYLEKLEKYSEVSDYQI